LKQLDSERYQLAYLPNPGMSPTGLRQALARELYIEDVEEFDSQGVLDALHRRLIELATNGKSTVLLIDEAQGLPVVTLEALRLLTNLETERTKLLQVVLFGQPELDTTLARNDLRQLRQRITFSYRLRKLDRHDTTQYLNERMTVAGYRGNSLFDQGAIRRLVKDSGGIPRLINILAHKALMVAYGEGRRQVTAKHVKHAWRDTEGARSVVQQDTFWSKWHVVILTLLLFIAAGLCLMQLNEVLI
ncbi:AAA family ATPase, partial [Pseudomonas sp. AB6]